MKAIPLILSLAAGPAAAAEASAGAPFAAVDYWAPVMDAYRPGRIHGLANLDFTDRFITANGLVVEDQGLMIQPTLLLATPVYADPSAWLQAATLTLGAWASWDSEQGGLTPDHWREVDLYAGLTLLADSRWKLTAFHTTFRSLTDSFPTAAEFALGLTCDDSDWLGAAALRPFAEIKWQTEGSTTLPDPAVTADEGWMGRFGVVPQRQFGPVKAELPVFLTVVSDGFYQEFDESAGVWRAQPGGFGFASAALKVSLPVTWLSTARLGTTAYAAVQYYHLGNAGLLDTNQALDPDGDRRRDLLQFHLGLSATF